jgi:phosphopantothenoylcysteine synthetase/decarboxylase
MTNFSTGALGSELANYLVEQGRDVELLLGYYATCEILPATNRLQIFTTSADLGKRLEALASAKVGAVFHAAAVSDFTFGKVMRKLPGGKLSEIRSGKISTRHGKLLAELEPAPKIIGRLRRWFPKAQLIGWKYEVDGNRAQAIALAQRQLEENATDACVVNGAAYGTGFGLVQGNGARRHLQNRAALFKALANL